MAPIDEGILHMLSSEDGLHTLMSAATEMLNKPADASPPPSSTESTASASPSLSPDLFAVLGGLLGSSPAASADGTASAPLGAASALPQLLQTFTGKSNHLKEERLNLVKAMKPYLAEGRGASVDRAIKMANMAKAAKSALGFLGR